MTNLTSSFRLFNIEAEQPVIVCTAQISLAHHSNAFMARPPNGDQLIGDNKSFKLIIENIATTYLFDWPNYLHNYKTAPGQAN